MKNELALVDTHIENIGQGKFDQNHPFFYHKDYMLHFTRLMLKGDAINQPIVDTLFEVRPKGEKWDTAEVLEYLSRVVFYLKSFVQCSRVCINYDTAWFNGGKYRKQATVNIVYLVDKQTMQNGRAEYLRTRKLNSVNHSPTLLKGGAGGEVASLEIEE